MGRGRARAKQAKVARELKYRSPEADFEALKRELATLPQLATRATDESRPMDDEDDRSQAAE